MSDYLNPDEGDEAEAGAGAPREMEFGGVDFPAAGEYEVVVYGGSFGQSKSAGNPMIILALNSPDVAGASAKYYLVNSPAAKWRFDKDLETFGITPPKVGEKIKLDVDRDFVGKKALAVGKVDTFNGHQSWKWISIRPTFEGPGARAFTTEAA